MKTVTITSGWRLFWLWSAIVLTLSAAILAVHPDPVEAVHLVIRLTAYTSFVPFLAAFVASPLVALAPSDGTRWLLRERRYLGLAFAFSHLVHLVAIISYGVLNPQLWQSRSAATNTPGTIGYLFIALLTVTSFQSAKQHMTAVAWKRLHTTGIWVIACVYALSFLSRIPSMSALYAIPLAILGLAIAIRVLGKRAQARKRASRRDRSHPPAAAPNEAME